MTELNYPFALNLLVNIASISLLCYGCYFRASRNTQVAGSFLLFGIGIHIITHLLQGVDLSMEFAFGLFAVFTMLRYRTDTISIKEMTYLFLVTAIALLTSVSILPPVELIALNLLICFMAYLVDTPLLNSRYLTQTITYEKIDYIRPGNRELLLEDLCKRTGLAVVAADIVHIDFLKDVAEIHVKYLPENGSNILLNPVQEKNNSVVSQ